MKTMTAIEGTNEVTRQHFTTSTYELQGVEVFKVTKTRKVLESSYELNSETNQRVVVYKNKLVSEETKEYTYPLVEITATELASYRESDTPSVVFKIDGKLYYSKIPYKLNLVSTAILGSHACSSSERESCGRLYPVPEKDGGCSKVSSSQGIEMFPWITSGYETFNVLHPAFVVAYCEHYRPCPPPKKKLTTQERNELKVAIAQFIWPDVETITDLRKINIDLD